jgi:hypothetical protein
MTPPTIPISPRPAGRLAARQARRRWPELDHELLDQILAAVPAARPRHDRRRVLDAWAALEQAEPTDLALSEHLETELSPDERSVLAIRAARMVPRPLAAPALGRPPEELARLEAAAAVKAVALTLAYHEAMICEPAALAEADSPGARRDAVRGHLATCRSCRAEFAARVAHVLRHAGGLAATGR